MAVCVSSASPPLALRHAGIQYEGVPSQIWCPLVYGSYQIPMAVLTNGGKLREVPPVN